MTISTGDVFIGEIVDGMAEGVFGNVVDHEQYRDGSMIRWQQGGETFTREKYRYLMTNIP